MRRILDIISQEGLVCLPCTPVNLDIQRFQEYRDSDEHPAEAPFENPAVRSQKKHVSMPENRGTPIFRYFLDGSRRTYKVADVIVDGRYMPLVAGQVTVAVVHRDETGQIRPVHQFCSRELVLAFPERVSVEDLTHLSQQVASLGRQFNLFRYEIKADRDPVDLGVAKIMSRMHEIEVETVVNMAQSGLLTNDDILVVDGPLRFKKKFDLSQFRNVIGLSKTFRPSFTVGKGRGRSRQDVGSIACALEFGERTTAFRTTEDDKVLGMWYLRLRPAKYVNDPLAGIVKAECYAVDHDEMEQGLDSSRIDTISSHLLHERNVSPYGVDSRWASHIYPIYLAEMSAKVSFLSDLHFRALF